MKKEKPSYTKMVLLSAVSFSAGMIMKLWKKKHEPKVSPITPYEARVRSVEIEVHRKYPE